MTINQQVVNSDVISYNQIPIDELNNDIINNQTERDLLLGASYCEKIKPKPGISLYTTDIIIPGQPNYPLVNDISRKQFSGIDLNNLPILAELFYNKIHKMIFDRHVITPAHFTQKQIYLILDDLVENSGAKIYLPYNPLVEEKYLRDRYSVTKLRMYHPYRRRRINTDYDDPDENRDEQVYMYILKPKN
jgi:hypothetical protein